MIVLCKQMVKAKAEEVHPWFMVGTEAPGHDGIVLENLSEERGMLPQGWR